MSTLKTEFKPVLEHDALSRLERDLHFHPVATASPRVLTPAEIERFNRDGYLRPFRAFDAAEIADIRRYFDDLLAQVVAAGGDSYSISSAHLKYGRVWDLLTHPTIVAHVRDLLGENVIGWGSHFFCKMPGDGKKVGWHQDASYWPLSPSKAVTVWLAIDDADVENACMRFVAGSHHFGAMTFRPSSPGDHNVLNQTIENAEEYGTIVDDCLRAGEFSMHSDLLLHGSEANASTRRRCGLTLRYAAADVRAHLDWNQKGVWVSGTDPTGHWVNRPRPR
ncbi:MAG TPA: phytanoyl-CoA dioxygenase family protein [Gemmataceae bacterium]|jgi:chlorinating enzyme|nr:phytanoyl-CoA dioxygenase family protein [Gemmataceae bacterium]